MEFFKIGSGDLTAYDQIYETCKYKKPILLSTGLSTLKEIKETLNFIKLLINFIKIKKILQYCNALLLIQLKMRKLI